MSFAKMIVMLACMLSLSMGLKETQKAALVDAKVTPLFSTDLKDFLGKEGLMIV